MQKKSKVYVISCVLFSLLLSFNINAKALRSPVQTGEQLIIARGDIPTPDKYKQATQSFMIYVTDNISEIIYLLNQIKTLLKAGDLLSAQKDYIKAHQHYEMIRPIVNLFGNTDRILNSRADYFLNGVTDYRFKGFHLVEYLLFSTKNNDTTLDAVDELLMYTTDLKKRVEQEQIEFPKLVQSSADFIEIIIQEKLAGHENIYSHSDLADIAANLKGSQQIIHEITPFIPEQKLSLILNNYQRIDSTIDRYKINKDDYKPYGELAQEDKNKLYSLLSNQAYLLATLRATLDVDVYYKYQAKSPHEAETNEQ